MNRLTEADHILIALVRRNAGAQIAEMVKMRLEMLHLRAVVEYQTGMIDACEQFTPNRAQKET